MAYSTATLTGTYQVWDGTPASGTVEIIPNSPALIDAEGDVILSGRVKVTLDEDGSFSEALPATDDATVEPATGRQYTVVAKLRHQHLKAVTGIELAGGETVDMAGVTSAAETSPTLSVWLTEEEYASVVARVGTLETAVASVPSDAELDAAYAATAAAPAGVTATDEAALAAAHTALPAAGGIIRLRRGAYKINSVTFTKPVTLVGEGGALIGDGSLTPIRALTTIVSTSATADCLTLAGKGSTVLDLAVVNEAASTPTAGTGIKATGMSQGHLARVAVVGFWNNIETRGTHWTIDSCHIYDPVNYGLWGNNDALGASYVDHGDYGVFNTIISTYYKTWAGVAGFKWTGGGGIRWIGNKINGGTMPGSPGSPRFQYGAHIEATATTGTTGEINLTGGGIANCTVANLRITQSGTGAFIHTKVNGLQINSSSGSCVGIHVGAASIGNINQIRDVTITDNTFAGIPGSHIIADYVTGLTVGNNHHSTNPTDGTSPLIRLGDGTETAAPLHAQVAPQTVRGGGNVTIVEDWRSAGNNGNRSGLLDLTHQRDIYISAVSTPVSLYTVELFAGDGVAVEVSLTGRTANSAFNSFARKPMMMRQRRAVSTPDGGSGGTLNVATLGTDESAGTGTAGVQVLYDTATATNKVTIKVQTTDATQVAMNGLLRVTVSGRVKRFSHGVK